MNSTVGLPADVNTAPPAVTVLTEVDPLFCLMGPTASGKTDIAMALCDHFPFEIVSVDAALVYRGLDIGTAKPDAALRQRYPHHLVDIRDPRDTYSAADFVRDFRHSLSEIRARHHWPLLVGGTMFYFNALETGFASQPGADQALRDQISARAEAEGWPALHRELVRLDPERAADIDINDRQRIQRALEICMLTGAAVSPRRAPGPGGLPLVKIAIAPLRRDWLHQRIESRFHGMLANGLLEEVKTLLNQQLPLDCVALRTVGYRQAGEYLQGKVSYNDLVARAIAATRQLAKRQLTWLRNQGGVTWMDCARTDLLEQLAVYIESKRLLQHGVRC